MSNSAETIPSSGDTNFGPLLVGVNWAVFSPSTILVGLRVGTRIWITHNFGWDDAVILLAQITNAIGMAFVMLEIKYGLGRHVHYLPADHYVWFLKYDFFDWVQVFITLALSKISICLFLLRISKFERWRNFLFGLIGFIIITHTPLTILILLQCIPLNKNWNTSVPGRCFSKQSVEVIIIIQGVISIITDFIGAAFPIVLLWNAKLNLRTKIALNLLMGLGVITGTVCIVRTSYSWEILSDDLTWVGVGNALTRILEVNFGIIGACAPIMRPLYLHLRARFFPPKPSDSMNSEQAPASKPQWYSPPRSRPWHKRVFHAPEPTDKPDGIPQRAVNDSSQPTPTPTPRQGWLWPQGRPECATWAKDDKEPDVDDSFDLPIQGTRKSGGNDIGGDGDGNEEEEEPDVFGTFRFNRGWV